VLVPATPRTNSRGPCDYSPAVPRQTSVSLWSWKDARALMPQSSGAANSAELSSFPSCADVILLGPYCRQPPIGPCSILLPRWWLALVIKILPKQHRSVETKSQWLFSDPLVHGPRTAEPRQDSTRSHSRKVYVSITSPGLTDLASSYLTRLFSTSRAKNANHNNPLFFLSCFGNTFHA